MFWINWDPTSTSKVGNGGERYLTLNPASLYTQIHVVPHARTWWVILVANLMYLERVTHECNVTHIRSFDKWEYVKDTPYTENHLSDGIGSWFWGCYPSLWEENGGNRQKANAIDGTQGFYQVGPIFQSPSHFKTELQTGTWMEKSWACKGYFRI